MAAVPSIGRASRIEGATAPEADVTRALYEQYANQIFRYCLHQLGSREEAEDAVQSTFLNAFRGLRRGVVPELESAWLFKIAHNVCLSRRRSTWRRGRIESAADFDIVEELTPAPSRRADELMGLQDVLEEMPENQRRAILLREWQGLSYREIAEELELSQAAVETLIFRARRSLAQGLEQPPEPKRKRLARAADFGNILAGIKSALVGGGAAVKVAATVAIVSGTTVVATAPVQPHRSHQPKAPAPASAPERSSSSVSSGAPSVVAASPAGGLRAAAERRGTQGPAVTAPEVRGHVAGTAAPDPSTVAAPPVVQAAPPEAVPAAPVEQEAAPSRPEHTSPAAPAPTASAPSDKGKGETDKTKAEPRTESRPDSTTEAKPTPATSSTDTNRGHDAGKGAGDESKDKQDKHNDKRQPTSSQVLSPVPTGTMTTQSVTVATVTTAGVATPAPKSQDESADHVTRSAVVTQTLPAPAPTLTSLIVNTPAAAPASIQADAQSGGRDKDKEKGKDK